MSKYRRAARVDANQNDIADALERAGYTVAKGHDDLLVGKGGVTLWVEIKSSERKKKTGLTDSQKRLLANWGGAYIVASSAEEIMNWEGWR